MNDAWPIGNKFKNWVDGCCTGKVLRNKQRGVIPHAARARRTRAPGLCGQQRWRCGRTLSLVFGQACQLRKSLERNGTKKRPKTRWSVTRVLIPHSNVCTTVSFTLSKCQCAIPVRNCPCSVMPDPSTMVLVSYERGQNALILWRLKPLDNWETLQFHFFLGHWVQPGLRIPLLTIFCVQLQVAV